MDKIGINIPKESSGEVIFGLIEKEWKVRKDRVEDLCRVCGIEVARYYRIKRGEVRLSGGLFFYKGG